MFADDPDPQSVAVEDLAYASLPRRVILLRSVRMLLNFVRSSEGRKAKLSFATLLILLVSINGFNVLISYVSRDFMTAIEQKQMTEFLSQAMLMIGLFIASTVAAAFYRFCEETLALLWRCWLTDETMRHYLQHRAYQYIELSQRVQYPDQRISEDIRALTVTALSLILVLLNSMLSIIAFASVLWSISPLLFVVSFLYATAGSLLTYWLGHSLIALNSRQVDCEADFRGELLHIRSHAEPIALLRRESTFLQRLQERLSALSQNTKRMIRVNRNLTFFTGNYNYLIQIIPALIVAPFFIEGKAEFGVIAQSALAFTILVNAFSVVVSQFPAISSFAAVMTRLSALSQANEKADKKLHRTLEIIDGSTNIRYEKVTVRTRDNEAPLVHEFTATIEPGQRVLVCAKRKESLLRLFNATSGIEDYSIGKLHRPSLDEVFFLPEKPYLGLGTLREALTANGCGRQIDEADILKVLRQLGQHHAIDVAGGLDTPHNNWSSFLSIGQQKMLNIARLLLVAPKFAYLLRLDSVLSDERVNLVMKLLRDSSITYINLGEYTHLEYYDLVFEIAKDGSWTRKEIHSVDPMDTLN